MSYQLPYTIPNPVSYKDVIIDKKTINAYYKNRLLAKKRRFEYDCDVCGKISITSRGNQMKRLHPWKCDSCIRSAEWSNMSRQERQERNKESARKNRLPAAREQSRLIMKELWQDPDSFWNSGGFIPPMHQPGAPEKLSQTIKDKMLNDENFHEELMERLKSGLKGTLIKTNQPDGKPITLRSTYEYRISKILTHQDYDWKYEPKAFYLPELNTTYTPDFYIPSLNTWIEVKGWWQGQSKSKWEEFSKNRNTALLFLEDISHLEKGVPLENKINYKK